MSIVCSRISPSGNIVKIMMLQAQIMAFLLNHIPLNKVHLVVNEF